MAVIKDTVALIDALGVKDLVELGTSLMQQGVDERKSLVEVPEVYAADYRLKLDDAKRWLEEDGLKVEAVVVQPDIAFKDCSDLEVVATNYTSKQKVKPGTRIVLKYVTSEVIDASRKLFEESEKKKVEEQAEKAKKKAEQNAKIKQNLGNAAAKIQHGADKAATNTKKGVTKIFSSVTKKESPKDSAADE